MIDLDELERLYGAATGGEWRGGFYPSAGAEVRVKGEHTADDGIWDTLMYCPWRGPFSLPETRIQDERDVAFAATAHNLMPEIIAELRTLRGDVERLRAELRGTKGFHQGGEW